MTLAVAGCSEAPPSEPTPTAPPGTPTGGSPAPGTQTPATPDPAPGTQTPATPDPGATADPGSGQIALVRIGINGPVANLDPEQPMLIPDVQAAVLLAGQLFRFDIDGEPQPDLIESWEVSPDGLVYTMQLHEGMVYSDGTPVTAEDAVFAFERVREGPQVAQFLIQHLVSVEATDARTIVWTLSQPEPDFLYFFGFQYVLVHPKGQLENNPDYFSSPVSSGPYVLTEGGAGSSRLVLDENPNYVHGPVAISRLELIAVPDLTARSLQLGQGQLDYVHDLAPSVRGVIAEDVRTFPHPSGGNFALVINEALGSDHPLSNRDVREAISLAVDRAQIGQRAFFGVSQPVNGFMYPGAPEQLAVLPNDGQRDLDAARAILAETPFAEGFEFRLVAWVDRPGWQDAAVVVRENLAEIGITATIESVDAGTALAKLQSGDYEAQYTGHTSGTPALFYLYFLFGPGAFWANARGYEPPARMIELFDLAAVELDPSRRLELIHEIQRLGYENFSYIPLNERVELSGSRVPEEALLSVSGKNFLVVGTMGR